jgi:hypothetical protein
MFLTKIRHRTFVWRCRDRDVPVSAGADAKPIDELPPRLREGIEIVATTRAGPRDVALSINHATQTD